MINPIAARNIKIIALVFVGALASFLTFYFLDRFLVSADFFNAGLAICCAWLFLIIIALEVVFTGNLKLLTVLIFGQSAASLLVFYPYLSEPLHLVLVGAFLFAALTCLGAARGFKEIKNGINIRFLSVAHRTLPRAVMGIFLFVAVLFYFYFFQLGSLSGENARKWFDRTLNSTTPVLQIWFPDVTFDMDIDQALNKMSEVQIRRSQLQLLRQGVDIGDMSPTVQEGLITTTANNIKNALSKIMGEIEPNSTLGNAFYNALQGQIVNLSGTTKLLIEIGLIVALFLALKVLAFILYLPAEFFAFIVFKILLLTGFAYISIEERSKEIVVI